MLSRVATLLMLVLVAAGHDAAAQGLTPSVRTSAAIFAGALDDDDDTGAHPLIAAAFDVHLVELIAFGVEVEHAWSRQRRTCVGSPCEPDHVPMPLTYGTAGVRLQFPRGIVRPFAGVSGGWLFSCGARQTCATKAAALGVRIAPTKRTGGMFEWRYRSDARYEMISTRYREYRFGVYRLL